MAFSRDELAEFAMAHQERIEAIARRKMPRGVRTGFGSDDAFSTVVRRLDALAERGLVRAENERQLWALIKSIVENVSISRLRLVESTATRSGADATFWSSVNGDLRRCGSDSDAFTLVFEMMLSLSDSVERQIFLFRLWGTGHRVIAQQLDMPETAVRKRWSAVQARLRERFHRESEA